MADPVQLYDTTYSAFELSVPQVVRLETYGEDIGQNSWLTTDEWRAMLTQLALFLARTTGAQITGIDVNAHAIGRARDHALHEEVASLARFEVVDADRPLPFDDATFDAVVCIDAVNHLADRFRVLREWHRVLKPGGRILFTDPVVVTGSLSNDEIALRSSIGFFVFTPRGEDERLIRESGFELLRCDDSTANVAHVGRRWRDVRDRHRSELVESESESTFEGVQQFLSTVHALADERRLSRFTFLARRTQP